MNLRTLPSVQARREAVEKEAAVKLPHIGSFSLDESVAASRNCENMIGVAQIPMGVAGPLRVLSQQSDPWDVYVPLATTEGALVASVSRGVKAITTAGGALVDSHRIGATRGPVFRVAGIAEGRKLFAFLDTHFEELQEAAARTSGHLKLKKYTATGVGTYRFVRFVFDTQDAMGLNMVTIATDAIVSYIRKETGISCLALSGNFCVDKKPSYQNFLRHRGIEVWAEVVLPKSILTDVLKTTAQQVFDVWLGKCMMGSVLSGSLGFNGQYANVVAAIFLATGQDPAHVVEGSMGVTTAEARGEDLYVSIFLPSLMVGTVGGGTGLATQNEALTLLGVAGGSPAGEGGNHAQRFAEIIGAAVLAGEISLLSSLTEGTLARAHETLARGKKGQ
jgi:hydroxymethylglutaryl-CoA reductase (NADPH)